MMGKTQICGVCDEFETSLYIYTFFIHEEKIRDNYGINYALIYCIFGLLKNSVYICFKKICHKCHIVEKTLEHQGFGYVAYFFIKKSKTPHGLINRVAKPFLCGVFF